MKMQGYTLFTGTLVIVAAIAAMAALLAYDVKLDDRLERVEHRLEAEQVHACADFLTVRFDQAMAGVENKQKETGNGPGLAEMAPVVQDLSLFISWAYQGLLEPEVAISRFDRVVNYFETRGVPDEDWEKREHPRLQGMVQAIPSRN